MNAAIEIGVCIVLLFIAGGSICAEATWMIFAWLGFGLFIVFAQFWIPTIWAEASFMQKYHKKWNRKRRAKKYGKPDMTDEEECLLKWLELYWDNTWDKALYKLSNWQYLHGMMFVGCDMPMLEEFDRLYTKYEKKGWLPKREI